jgi:hypothetical protein
MNPTIAETAAQIFDLNQICPISPGCANPAPRKNDRSKRCYGKKQRQAGGELFVSSFILRVMNP